MNFFLFFPFWSPHGFASLKKLYFRNTGRRERPRGGSLLQWIKSPPPPVLLGDEGFPPRKEAAKPERMRSEAETAITLRTRNSVPRTGPERKRGSQIGEMGASTEDSQLKVVFFSKKYLSVPLPD